MDWLIDFLIGWLIAWWISESTYWLTNYLINWSIDLLSVYWLIDDLIDWLINSFIHILGHQPNDCAIVELIHHLIYELISVSIGWLIRLSIYLFYDILIDWSHDWVIRWLVSTLIISSVAWVNLWLCWSMNSHFQVSIPLLGLHPLKCYQPSYDHCMWPFVTRSHNFVSTNLCNHSCPLSIEQEGGLFMLFTFESKLYLAHPLNPIVKLPKWIDCPIDKSQNPRASQTVGSCRCFSLGSLYIHLHESVEKGRQGTASCAHLSIVL